MKQTFNTKDRVINHWHSIFTSFGVDSRYLTGKHTKCPICKSGKDKFRFDDLDGRGTFYCNSCRAGDGWRFLKLYKGWNFKEAANQVDLILGSCKAVMPKPAYDDIEKKRARLNQVRKRIKNIQPNDAIYSYLINRGISPKVINLASDSIGVIDDFEYWHDGKKTGDYPSMVVMIVIGNKPSSYHVTYTNKGHKADIEPCRKILPATTSITGGAIRLMKHYGILGIAEGVETALSAYQLFGVPTWAALSANLLAQFEIPKDVNELHIFGDCDDSFTGQKAAYELARKAVRQGLTVKVIIPDQIGFDWNDELVNSRTQEAA